MKLIALSFVMLVGLQSAVTPTYEAFVQLPAERRDAVFAELPAETKAAFLRTRFEGWLAEHREQLNTRQIAAVQDAIDLVTPEIYQQAPDVKTRERQDLVSKRLSCALGGDLAYSFAKGDAAPARVERTWVQALQSWADWVVDCVVK